MTLLISKEKAEKLIQGLQQENNRSTYLNALPGNSRTGFTQKLDLSVINSFDEDFVGTLMMNIYSKGGAADIVMNQTDEELGDVTHLESKKKVRNVVKRSFEKILAKSKLFKEEFGYNALKIGYPIIVQKSNQGIDSRCIPLFIWDVSLKSKSKVNNKFELTLNNEEAPVLNPALEGLASSGDLNLDTRDFEVLKNQNFDDFTENFLVALDKFYKRNESEFQKGINDYYNLESLPYRVKKDILDSNLTVAKFEMWNTAILSNFKATKYSIIKDYESFKNGIPELKNGRSQVSEISPQSLDPSQSGVLKHINSKKHIVIHGPPGTGKSHTITGIITAALAKNKKIAVVCQKMAALDVLEESLEELKYANGVIKVTNVQGDRSKVVRKARDISQAYKNIKLTTADLNRKDILSADLTDRFNDLRKKSKKIIESKKALASTLIGSEDEKSSWSDLVGKINRLKRKFKKITNKEFLNKEIFFHGSGNFHISDSKIGNWVQSYPDIKRKLDELQDKVNENYLLTNHREFISDTSPQSDEIECLNKANNSIDILSKNNGVVYSNLFDTLNKKLKNEIDIRDKNQNDAGLVFEDLKAYLKEVNIKLIAVLSDLSNEDADKWGNHGSFINRSIEHFEIPWFKDYDVALNKMVDSHRMLLQHNLTFQELLAKTQNDFSEKENEFLEKESEYREIKSIQNSEWKSLETSIKNVLSEKFIEKYNLNERFDSPDATDAILDSFATILRQINSIQNDYLKITEQKFFLEVLSSSKSFLKRTISRLRSIFNSDYRNILEEFSKLNQSIQELNGIISSELNINSKTSEFINQLEILRLSIEDGPINFLKKYNKSLQSSYQLLAIIGSNEILEFRNHPDRKGIVTNDSSDVVGNEIEEKLDFLKIHLKPLRVPLETLKLETFDSFFNPTYPYSVPVIKFRHHLDLDFPGRIEKIKKLASRSLNLNGEFYSNFISLLKTSFESREVHRVLKELVKPDTIGNSFVKMKEIGRQIEIIGSIDSRFSEFNLESNFNLFPISNYLRNIIDEKSFLNKFLELTSSGKKIWLPEIIDGVNLLNHYNLICVDPKIKRILDKNTWILEFEEFILIQKYWDNVTKGLSQLRNNSLLSYQCVKDLESDLTENNTSWTTKHLELKFEDISDHAQHFHNYWNLMEDEREYLFDHIDVEKFSPKDVILYLIYDFVLKGFLKQNESLLPLNSDPITAHTESLRVLQGKLGLGVKKDLKLSFVKGKDGVISSGGSGGQFDKVFALKSSKNKRKKSLRDIVGKYSTEFRDMFPVQLLTPEVICNLYEGERDAFDFIIFDEASQLELADSLPILFKGKTIVVAGDEHQMPPSRYFKKSIEIEEDEDEDEYAVDIDVESLLEFSISQKNLFESNFLDFHYRSEHPALIKFSNEYIYRRLKIMPSLTSSYCPIEFIHLEDSVWENTTNFDEAEKVVDILGRINLDISDAKDPKILIGTLNANQRDLITNQIAEKQIKDSEFNQKMQRFSKQGFSIKNLENLQGDESDIVIISTGYGNPPSGKEARKSYGDINRDKGYRLLNVLITRAKRKVFLITSVPKNHYRQFEKKLGERTDNSRSVGMFYAYLYYAELVSSDDSESIQNLKNILNEFSITNFTTDDSSEGNENVFDSDFEEDVYDVLLEEFKGLGEFQTQEKNIDNSFRIDIVFHPKDHPGLAIAIECDGATYHSGYENQLQDAHRQSVLEGIGYKFVRVWSTNWFKYRASAIHTLFSQIKDLIKRFKESETKEIDYLQRIYNSQKATAIDKLNIDDDSDDADALLDLENENQLTVDRDCTVKYSPKKNRNKILTMRVVPNSGRVKENIASGLYDTVMVINSPITKAMYGKEEGEEFDFNSNIFIIESIELML